MSIDGYSSIQVNKDFSGDNKTAFRLNNKPAGGFVLLWEVTIAFTIKNLINTKTI